MISNAPGVLNSTLQFGQLQALTSAAGDPNTTLSLNPSAFDFKPPRVEQWNVGIQHKLMQNIILDVAYVGSDSSDLLRQVQINAVPIGAAFLAQNQDPTRTSSTPGGAALPTDFLRPFKGYSGIRMWDYSGYANYNALQTSVTRRFDKGFMFSGFWVWSKALGINSTDFAAGVPNLSAAQTRALDYSLLDYDRPHNITLNAVYQMKSFTESKALGAAINDWQLSGVYRWTSGRPYTVGYSIAGIGAANLTGSSDGNPNARIVVTCDPGNGYSGDPYRQLNTSCFQAPNTNSTGNESARFFARLPPINNLDMSLSKNFRIYGRAKAEFRVDMFNVLNHTQFTTINSTANFASLGSTAITNLPFDAAGNLVRPNGFGTISGTAPPRQLQLVTRISF
jgi:hypothetical protein